MDSCKELFKDRDGDARKPEFFKVLMHGFDKELGIPPAFVKYIMNLRGKSATLISPLGKPWSVHIHGQNRNMCFREGWREFAQAHDLKMGCFMVFSYEGDGTFSFQVFDTNACWRNYSPIGVQSVRQMDIKQEMDSKNDAEDIIQRPTVQVGRRQKRMMDGGEMSIQRKWRYCSGRKSFEAIIKDHNLTRNYMHIPVSFRESNDIAKNHEVILNDVEGRSWRVRVCNRGRKGVCLAQGWQEFCADTGLEEGDKCIFERASMKDNKMLVRILKRSSGMEQRCSCCMNWEEHCYWDHFETTRIHFFKVMDGDFSHRMIIPKKFVKNFKEELSQNIQLKGPSGNLWHVRLSNDAEDMIFNDGWKKFVEDHYIKEGDNLVFKYHGNLCFSVLIFDQTGCEKEACYFVKDTKNKAKESCQSVKEILEDSLEILHESLPPKAHSHGSSKILCNDRKQMRRRSAPRKVNDNISDNSLRVKETNPKRKIRDFMEILHESLPPKAHGHGSSKIFCNDKKRMQRLSAPSKLPQVNDNISDNILHVRSTNPKRKIRDNNFSRDSVNEKEQIVKFTKVKKQNTKKEFQRIWRRLATAEGKAQAQLKAISYQPTHPFFLKVMKPTHVYKKFFLTIPNCFAAEHLPRENRTIDLRLPHGQKMWRMSYLHYDCFSGLGKQWKNFAIDNSLEEGDVCVFELTGELVLDVHIFRAVIDSTLPNRESNSPGKK
ncbi:B3 domain-containing protein_Os12g40080 isoform X2 [Elaeis guineensis]|uniref:B3 domain-containing protein Os03g0621600 isoform X2 n=1 Tax=Elaeis guineensis var. tenera TaxID=51953 RepID=A0A6J0PP18_ELAGV|nr:putative B3 domain-containing protein Os03g0621600 isoform X2 [Elaeis guineensis]